MLSRILRRPLWLCLAALCALGMASAYAVHHPTLAPTEPSIDIRHLPPLAIGDWVLRMGTSTDSRVVQQLSSGAYSHIGMVVAVEPRVMVIHATTDDHPERANQVLLSTLEEFFQPGLASRIAIARPTFLQTPQKLAIARALLAEQGKPFVLEPRDTAHRYCTTLLADAIRAEHPAFDPPWQHIDVAFFRGEYLFPQAFVDYPGVEWVYRR
ncbi:hypothetical protein DN826_17260 [Stutzerimonas nosocomialis]|uniref:YiiX/YebB-like N1pC/P60 family cysteine hydrolase n=1 Tax=Stutzerimonas nosocomialis TaxID=1056496 RepID=UPI001107E3DE|nr:YiiX/YebB-like N1pC/P60 family cysteine hydrolase [Stutzerimonas nosocomialis]TLX53663.1 hypothetical protein DN826_17260 [Stutzerimonas nosocomialis]